MRGIRFNETIVRHKLLHSSHRRSSVTKNDNSISIYPETIAEIFEKVFTKDELDLLPSLGKAVLSLFFSSIQCLSILLQEDRIKARSRTRKKVQQKILHQHTTIMGNVASDRHRRHGLPTKSTILTKLSAQLETMFNQQFSSP